MALGNPNSLPPAASHTIVLGAGPAGLTAALSLVRRGQAVTVAEAEDQVGGIARTVVRDGYRFDLGGHRFFTKSAEVEALWREILGDELLTRPRLSRILWRGRFIDYPLRVGDVVRKVGPMELGLCTLSYARAAARRRGGEETFEQWVTSRFGRRLFELFFRAYTEKVWGVPTSEIRAEWAAQRIRDLSFSRAARAAVFRDGGEVRSLIEEFLYPRLGPGQMWEAMAAEVRKLGGVVLTGSPATRLEVSASGCTAILADGIRVGGDSVISSLPLRSLAAIADPGPPAHAAAAAAGLRYRDFITVALAVKHKDPFPDNWVYVHEPHVRVGRIQNFRAWSPAMVPREDRACLGLEYFCFEGDELWRKADTELIDLAAIELEQLGLCARADVERGWVVRVPKAYPIYDPGYADRLEAIRAWLSGMPRLQQIGRNGLHRYNNSDHSMLTALRAVENLCDAAEHDIWAVNAESAYHEEQRPDEQPYLRAPLTPSVDGPRLPQQPNA